MKTIYKNTASGRPKVVGLGNFDGLHKGHMTLINTVIAEAKSQGVESMVYTFTRHPENILRKGFFTPLITSVDKKIELLSGTDLDYLYLDEFDEEYSRISPEKFVADILVGQLEVKAAVAGFNYRFGHKGSGDTKLLQKLADKYRFKAIVIPPVKIDNKVVSSTLIRSLIADGDMQAAEKYLGRHYSLYGTVKKGDSRGRRLGFPTANLQLEENLVIPARGVYLTKTKYGGTERDSITSIGTKPTFGDSYPVEIETHILDCDEDVYGKPMEVFFLLKLRDEMKFANGEELKKQVDADIVWARTLHSESRAYSG